MSRFTKVLQEIRTTLHIDPVDTAMLLQSRHTLLPEIFEVFGQDQAFKFMEVFGGKTIKVPSIEDMEKSLEALVIWAHVREASNKSAEIRKLALRFGKKVSEVRSLYKKVQALSDEQTEAFIAAYTEEEFELEEDLEDDEENLDEDTISLEELYVDEEQEDDDDDDDYSADPNWR